MTPRNNPWQSYRKVATQTATPGQLVLMLYEGAVSFLERAMVGFNYKDPLEFNQTINNNAVRAEAILVELNSRLDMERGEEVAANFRRLYNYLIRRVREGNLRKRRESLEEAARHLRVLRDSWAEMLRQGPQGGVPSAATLPAQTMLDAA